MRAQLMILWVLMVGACAESPPDPSTQFVPFAVVENTEPDAFIPSRYQGVWTLTQAIGAVPYADDVQRLIGQRLLITHDHIELAGVGCPTFTGSLKRDVAADGTPITKLWFLCGDDRASRSEARFNARLLTCHLTGTGPELASDETCTFRSLRAEDFGNGRLEVVNGQGRFVFEKVLPRRQETGFPDMVLHQHRGTWEITEVIPESPMPDQPTPTRPMDLSAFSPLAGKRLQLSANNIVFDGVECAVISSEISLQKNYLRHRPDPRDTRLMQTTAPDLAEMARIGFFPVMRGGAYTCQKWEGLENAPPAFVALFCAANIPDEYCDPKVHVYQYSEQSAVISLPMKNVSFILRRAADKF